MISSPVISDTHEPHGMQARVQYNKVNSSICVQRLLSQDKQSTVIRSQMVHVTLVQGAAYSSLTSDIWQTLVVDL